MILIILIKCKQFDQLAEFINRIIRGQRILGRFQSTLWLSHMQCNFPFQQA